MRIRNTKLDYAMRRIKAAELAAYTAVIAKERGYPVAELVDPVTPDGRHPVEVDAYVARVLWRNWAQKILKNAGIGPADSEYAGKLLADDGKVSPWDHVEHIEGLLQKARVPETQLTARAIFEFVAGSLEIPVPEYIEDEVHPNGHTHVRLRKTDEA